MFDMIKLDGEQKIVTGKFKPNETNNDKYGY